jgi:tetratricopeptide (TPR) repeat protein
MFELLLQADRALANGALDQAERTYWQLIELDPTNAIAVAGLARVWLERGDERSARTFADRALGIDPDSIAARRVIEAVDHESPELPAHEPAVLPLLGAEQLEALSRRHGRNTGGGDASDDVAGKAGRGRKAGGRATAAPATSTADEAGGGKAATRQNAAGKESRGRTSADQAAPLPAEPLRERRQAGRVAAAAAAAAAAVREPLHQHEPHHAMPIGRRLFEPTEHKAPPTDAFAAAEMAAAVEAVDAMDDSEGAAFEDTPWAAPSEQFEPGQQEAGNQADLLNAVDATTADDSVALRLALFSGSMELGTAEQEAARSAEEASAFEASEDSFEAAEAMAEAVRFLPLESGGEGPVEPSPDGSVESTEATTIEIVNADGAETAAVAAAMREVAASAYEEDPEPASTRRPFVRAVREEPSEEEAEAQALREAMAIVLEADGHAAEAEISPSPAGPAGPAGPVESSEPVESAGNAETASSWESATSSEPPASEADPGKSTRKHGLFHRIRGS